jgi:hypothetical protein
MRDDCTGHTRFDYIECRAVFGRNHIGLEKHCVRLRARPSRQERKGRIRPVGILTNGHDLIAVDERLETPILPPSERFVAQLETFGRNFCCLQSSLSAR